MTSINFDPKKINWRDKATYDTSLRESLLSPLEAAALSANGISRQLQQEVVESLHWYFTIDSQQRAPTVVVNAAMADVFHDIVGRIMAHIEIATIESLDNPEISFEIKQALLSYKKPQCHSSVDIDAYDHDQCLLRLTYYVHGDKPVEAFLLDGKPIEPAFAKYRACNYFRRMLMRQRIVWLPVALESTIEVMLDSVAAEIGIDQQQLITDATRPYQAKLKLLEKAKSTYPPHKRGREPLPFAFDGFKARALRWLANISLVRNRFKNAWVFVDRVIDADDSAEHLYRWVTQHHPEINAWFLLTKTSYDWNRLAAEGFRLVPLGLQRKLLFLNCEHIISSHADYMEGGLDRRRYGDLMRWRYTFLQHGVIMNDLSHWLSNQPFDIFVTTSPEEHASIVANDTPYTFTDREVKRTGLPRHDRLLRYAEDTPPSEVRTLLVMPTWRGGLVDARAASASQSELIAEFAKSDYARSWSAFLNNAHLKHLLAQQGYKLVFFPHMNSVPYIDAFSVPSHVEVATAEKTSFQELFARSTALVTDYTSVAFTFALLRRTVFYYQFDRESFYGGNHNWREGYFDYDRDGFGPVAFNEEDLINQVTRFLQSGAKTSPEYLARMERAMPEIDGRSCEWVFDCICNSNSPFTRSTTRN